MAAFFIGSLIGHLLLFVRLNKASTNTSNPIARRTMNEKRRIANSARLVKNYTVVVVRSRSLVAPLSP